MKELSTVRVARTSPETLVPAGQSLQIAYDKGEVLLTRVSWLSPPETLLRYRLKQLAFAKCDRRMVQQQPLGPVLGAIQILRNTHRYGFWDGMAATNLQNLGTPMSSIQVLKLGFLTPLQEFEMQALTLTECSRSRVSLADTAAYLNSRLIQARRGLR